MYIESFLKQFWRCIEWNSFGTDEEVREEFKMEQKIVGKDVYLSGLRLEYDYDEPEAPAFLSFDVWDIAADELVPSYFSTGHIHEFKTIKNGFIVITGNDKTGGTTFTFKKTKVNPFQEFERKQIRKRIADIEAGTANLQEHELIEE